jgi:hypothetical protein
MVPKRQPGVFYRRGGWGSSLVKNVINDVDTGDFQKPVFEMSGVVCEYSSVEVRQGDPFTDRGHGVWVGSVSARFRPRRAHPVAY